MRFTKIKNALKMDPFIGRISLFASLLYGGVYYWTAGYIKIDAQTRPGIIWVQDIQGLMWHMRAPFQWEAIAIFPIPKLAQIWLSIPNLLVAMALSLLVFGNLTLILIAFRHPTVCQLRKGRKNQSIAALLPALFTGFSCCAPTVLILWVSLFGSVSTLMVAALRWFLPLGLILLTLGIIAAYRSIPTTDVQAS